MTTATLPIRVSGSTTSTSLLLTRLTVAFSRRRAYPDAHPLLKTAERQAFETLTDLFRAQSTISFSLGDDELLIDNAPVEFGGAVANDFADRLRGRGVGTLAFDRQLTLESFSQSLRWLATDQEVSEDGVFVATDAPALEGVTIARIAYGLLAIGTAESNAHTHARDIWRLLATAAFFDDDEEMPDHAGPATDPPEASAYASLRRGADASPPAHRDPASGETALLAGDDDIFGSTGHREPGAMRSLADSIAEAFDDIEAGPADDRGDATLLDAEADAVQVARGIEQRLPKDGYSKRVAFVLLRVADQVSHAPPEQRELLSNRLRDVLGALQQSSVGSIIRAVGGGADQRRFMSGMIDAMPANAVVEWLERAASASEQDLSHHMLRLLSKLSARADEEGTATRTSEHGLRDAAKELVNGWTLDDPNPNAHGSLLNQLCRYDSLGTGVAMQDPGSGRIVQIALELDETGEDSDDAATELLTEGRVAELLQWAREAPGRRVADTLRALIESPDAVRSVLLKDPIDQADARALLSALDHSAAETLLDVLRDAEGRTARRLVYDRLRDFGAALTPLLLLRLDGAPWYFVRNLLALLRDTSTSDSESSGSSTQMLLRLLDHQFEQVRVEALRLLVADKTAGDAAIRYVLDDTSDRVVSVALDLLTADGGGIRRQPVSADLARRLLGFVHSAAHEDSLLARAVRVLSHAPNSVAIRDALVGLTARQTWIMRRIALSEVRPVMLAALEVLCERYGTDPQSAAVLALAARHTDSRVRESATRTGSRRSRQTTSS